MNVLETDRLLLRRFTVDDAAFVLGLLNDPGWLRFIGDRGIRTLDGARDYLVNGPIAMYERCGFGLYLTALKEESVPIGMCGLIKRDSLQDVDIGFAFMPQFRGNGYASEAAAAIMAYGKGTLGLERIVAITSPDNDGSINVLRKIGLKLDRPIRLPGEEKDTLLFVPELEARSGDLGARGQDEVGA